jgi:S-DNA-T family DNA segregation ATPase FtsK/SpoIIIE
VAGEAQRIAERVAEILAAQGVRAGLLRPPVVGARLFTLELAAQRGCVRAMDRAAADVVHQLATVDDLQAGYRQEGGRRLLQVARREPRSVQLPPLLRRAGAWLAARPGRFVLGEHDNGAVATGDLSEAASCHLLVGGMTGSGKSVLLRALAASLVHYHPPARILLTLVDPKRVSFGPLSRRLDAHLADPLCFEPREAITLLEGLVEEMELRYGLLLESGVDNLDEYHEVAGAALPRRVVIIDEFQDLVADKSTREPFIAAVQRLGAKARAAGIHLVLATQRPDAKTVPGGVKANLPGKIALRVQSAVNARIVLDTTGAELLLGRGDLLADLGQGLWRVQAPLVD